LNKGNKGILTIVLKVVFDMLSVKHINEIRAEVYKPRCSEKRSGPQAAGLFT
jgi:hypothetical protein